MPIISGAFIFGITQGIQGYAMSASKMQQAVTEWNDKCATLKDLNNQIKALNSAINAVHRAKATQAQAEKAQQNFESNIATVKQSLVVKKKHIQENVAIMTIGCIMASAIVVIIITLRAGKLENALNKIDKLNLDG